MKQLLAFLFFLAMIPSQAQNKLSPQGRMFYQDLKEVLQTEAGYSKGIPTAFREKYSISSIGNDSYIGVLLLVDQNFDRQKLEAFGVIYGASIGQILSARVRLQHFELLLGFPGIVYIECGSDTEPELERARYSLRSDSVYMGLGDLSMPYTGKGVVIAIIDWGFDYTHPMFYDTLMQNYRVSRAWDQNKNSGPAPQAYAFGTEYIGQNALLAAQEDTLYVFGPGSHGTHVGGIAGGGGAQIGLRGVAPEAELVFISLKRDGPSFIDAIKYVNDYAASVNKPYVVNMSFGNHSGPHDGSTLHNRALDSLAGKGAVFVASAGNNGGNTFHILEDFTGNDTLITEVANAIGLDGYWGESVNIWAEENASFEIQLELVNAQGASVFESAWFSTSANLSLYDTLYQSGGDTLVLRLVSENANALNNKPNLLFESRKLGSLRLILRIVGSGKTHLWHVARLENRVTNWGQPFKSGYPGAVAGNDEYAIGGPYAITKGVITVASHLAEVRLLNGTEAFGTLSTYSSQGPTADERVKPDVSGPGQDVLSSVNSFDPNPGLVEETVNFNGKTYSFVRYSGTSMSGPSVAGVVALMLQANPNLYAEEVKAILKTTARLDGKTGQIGPNGDLHWGWGKVNAYAAVRLAEIKSGGIRIRDKAPFVYYPNPVEKRQLTIESTQSLKIRLLDMQGKELMCFDLVNGNSLLDLGSLAAGAYLLEWQSGSEAGFEKLILP